MLKQDNKRNLLAQLQVFDLVQRGILLIDENGQIQGSNTAALIELGYQKEEITSKTIFEVNPRYSLLGWKRKWKQLLEKEAIQEDSELITSNDILYPVHSTLRLINIGNAYYCCLLIENLLDTNRYKDLLSLTAEAAKIGAWEYDLVSEDFLVTKQLNKIITGQEEEKFLSKQSIYKWMLSIMGKDMLKELIVQVKRSIEHGKAFETDLYLDQFKKPFLLHAVSMASEGITSKLFGIVQDITTVSARSEEMYMAQFAIDHAIEMIFWIKQDKSIIYSNKSSHQQLGYSKEEFQNISIFDIIPSLSDENWQEKWNHLKEKKSIEIKRLLKTKEGQLIPVYAHFNYLKYKGEELNVAFIRNTSMQKRQDEVLDLYFQTLNQAQDIILWVRQDKSLIYFNDRTHELLGYGQEELQTINIDDIYPNYDLFDHWDKLKAEESLIIQHDILSKTQKRIPVEATISKIQFNEEDCVCITYHPLAALRKKENQLQAAFEEIEVLKEKLLDEKTYLRAEIAEKYSFQNIITSSPKYQEILKQVGQVAATEANVLILGETGTGKELLARSIHQLSEREDEVLVKVNCAALPENLIESELFGHEKGAFTGAYQRKIGKFELADKGSIFLDEIGELPLDLQAKLLRVLQEGEFERVGSNQPLKVDVRIIAATNRNLEELVEKGKFRADLYYRLNVFPIRNLPLRERKEDIPLLVQHFVKKFCERSGRPLLKIPQRAINELVRYEFPGNVRELENLIERAVILSPTNKLNLDSVLKALQKNKKRRKKGFLSFEEMQKQYILEALERADWKITGPNSASELLGINGKTLASKMRKMNIKKN